MDPFQGNKLHNLIHKKGYNLQYIQIYLIVLPFLSFLHGIKTFLEEIRYYGNNVQLHSRTPKSSGRGLEVVCVGVCVYKE